MEKGRATKLNLWLLFFVTRNLVMVFLVNAGPNWGLLVVPQLFCLKALWKDVKKENTILCAFAVMIEFETQKCRKKTFCFFEFKSETNRDRQKRFSQNERRRHNLQKVANSSSLGRRSYMFAMATQSCGNYAWVSSYLKSMGGKIPGFSFRVIEYDKYCTVRPYA